MKRHLDLNLEDLPWPVNVLKFNQVLCDLQPGDDITATVSDGNVVGNLKQLLRCQPGLSFDIAHTDVDFRIHVTRPQRER